MKIVLAQTAGFCFGVDRAVNQAYEQVGKKNVYSYGPLIHNEQVITDLEQKGIKVINDLEELQHLEEGIVIIRSHGVPKTIYETLEKKGIEIADATCPYVRRIHKLVDKHTQDGEVLIIIGDEKHPEVKGIIGWCNTQPIIINSEEEANVLNIPEKTKVVVVSQTTFKYNKFKELVEIISKKGYDIFVFNTICDATEKRQAEVEKLAKQVDAMLVIGGANSSNTQKLYEISKKECEDTYYIKTLEDLEGVSFSSYGSVGITAGASTPNKIIKEVHDIMSEISFEQLLESSLITIHTGEVVKGTVLDVKEDEVILNIGYKSDGIITRNEFTNLPNVDLTTLVKVGDELQVKVLKVNDGEGQVLLTYKRLATEQGNKKLEEAFNNKTVLKAKVAQVLDGGLSVVIDEARVFIPASLVSDSYEKDLSHYAGQEIEFIITEFNPKRRRVIGDRKVLLTAQKAEKQKALLEKIKPGMTVEGRVKNVTDFGAFVDLDGIDGLLHISEMSWGRVDNPKKLFKVGDELKVLIKDIAGAGNKIALSLKFPEANPWTNASEKFAVGNVVTGRVARMTDFGAFVELEPGVDALLHVSQISKAHVEKPSDALSVNQTVTAKVVDFNEADKKISLSVKAFELENEKSEEETSVETE